MATLGRGATYTLQVTGVTDANGTSIDTASKTAVFVAADNTAPTATALVFLRSSLIRVVYSEPMTASSSGTGITNTANYRLDGTSGTTAFTSCVVAAAGLAADCTLAPPAYVMNDSTSFSPLSPFRPTAHRAHSWRRKRRLATWRPR